jgi:hypothetical protein
MYIEFRLPGGAAAGVALAHINIDIDNWVRKFDVKYHKTKIYKYTYRLCLASNRDYNYFALTWDPQYTISRNFEFKNPK